MNAELRETLELARALDLVISFSEHNGATLPVRRAAGRLRDGVVGSLRKACNDLENILPASDPKEIASFRASLEQGLIPGSKPSEAFTPQMLNKEIAALEERIERLKKKAA